MVLEEKIGLGKKVGDESGKENLENPEVELPLGENGDKVVDQTNDQTKSNLMLGEELREPLKKGDYDGLKRKLKTFGEVYKENNYNLDHRGQLYSLIRNVVPHKLVNMGTYEHAPYLILNKNGISSVSENKEEYMRNKGITVSFFYDKKNELYIVWDDNGNEVGWDKDEDVKCLNKRLSIEDGVDMIQMHLDEIKAKRDLAENEEKKKRILSK